jgi:CheY-like chemotaxis protein
MANMSHELRTPLNSLLILSRQLADNPDGNLTPRQMEYASTIHGAGSDLLSLINDILDLTKIESGTVTLDLEDIPFNQVGHFIERTFSHIGSEKQVAFKIDISPELPPSIYTEPKRLQQILKNLLANAFKFTEKGEVSLEISVANSGFRSHHPILSFADEVIAFKVVDTGIGIPLDKQKIIFEAFQQAEGSTNRKYGGTGLGLSISREISVLLGGEITLDSTPGRGSTFTLYLPSRYQGPAEKKDPVATKQKGLGSANISGLSQMSPVRNVTTVRAPYTPTSRAEYLRQMGIELVDDRDSIQQGDCVILIIEDDPTFAKVLLEVAREQKLKGLEAGRGDNGLAMAHGFHPNAIALDINLPDTDGWTLLEQLKSDSETRHIPVVIVSVEEDKARGIKKGAYAALTKPVSKAALVEAFGRVSRFVCEGQRNLLVVEDVERERDAVVDLVGSPAITITAVGTLDEAVDAIQRTRFDCIVLDLLLPGTKSFESIDKIYAQPEAADVPIIVYTGKDLTREEEIHLNGLANSVILKDVRSPERLLEETTLFLHIPLSSLPDNKRKMVEQLHDPIRVLTGKNALIVDDDARNIFAMTSLLERNGMQVMAADSGTEALAMLDRQSDVDIVLMDIMMPDMDGYETTSHIRQTARFRNLPIIAVTAKAMKGDREKCLAAGASDYVTKPVDPEQLLSLMRAWLHR